jgi:hypothetical protein
LGVLGGPGVVLVKPWGSPGPLWGTLGGPWGVLGGSLGDPVGDQVPQTLRTPMFQRPLCFLYFFYNLFSFSNTVLIFLCFCSRHGGLELLLGSLAGPQGMLEGLLGSLGGARKFLGGSG